MQSNTMGPALQQQLSDIVFLGTLQWDPASVDQCIQELFPQSRSRQKLERIQPSVDQEHPIEAQVEQAYDTQGSCIEVDAASESNEPINLKVMVDASAQTYTKPEIANFDGEICTISYPLAHKAVGRRMLDTIIEEELAPSWHTSHDAAVANDLDHRLQSIKSFREALRNRVLMTTQCEDVSDASCGDVSGAEGDGH